MDVVQETSANIMTGVSVVVVAIKVVNVVVVIGCLVVEVVVVVVLVIILGKSIVSGNLWLMLLLFSWFLENLLWS